MMVMTPTTRKRSSTRHHEQHDLIGDHLFFFPRVILSLLLLNTPLKMNFLSSLLSVTFRLFFALFFLFDTTLLRIIRIQMIEVILNDRLGKKIRVKCNEDDTIGDLKKLVAAQTGTRPEKIRYS